MDIPNTAKSQIAKNLKRNHFISSNFKYFSTSQQTLLKKQIGKLPCVDIFKQVDSDIGNTSIYKQNARLLSYKGENDAPDSAKS